MSANSGISVQFKCIRESEIIENAEKPEKVDLTPF